MHGRGDSDMKYEGGGQEEGRGRGPGKQEENVEGRGIDWNGDSE